MLNVLKIAQVESTLTVAIISVSVLPLNTPKKLNAPVIQISQDFVIWPTAFNVKRTTTNNAYYVKNNILYMNFLIQLIKNYSERYPDEKVAITMLSFIEDEKNHFSRSNHHGHFTGSAWILNPDKSNVILMEKVNAPH